MSATALHTHRLERKEKMCCKRWSRDSPAVPEEDHGEAGCPTTAYGRQQWNRSTLHFMENPVLEEVNVT